VAVVVVVVVIFSAAVLDLVELEILPLSVQVKAIQEAILIVVPLSLQVVVAVPQELAAPAQVVIQDRQALVVQDQPIP
jgi:hypothetical protein